MGNTRKIQQPFVCINHCTHVLYVCIPVYPGSRGPDVESEREKDKPEASGHGCWEPHFHVINLASVPTFPVWYREPIKNHCYISWCPQLCLGMNLRSQSETRFKTWTKYRHGSEILNGHGQRPFFFDFSLSVSVSLSVCLSVSLSLSLSLSLCVSLSVCLSVCLSFYFFALCFHSLLSRASGSLRIIPDCWSWKKKMKLLINLEVFTHPSILWIL